MQKYKMNTNIKAIPYYKLTYKLKVQKCLFSKGKVLTRLCAIEETANKEETISSVGGQLLIVSWNDSSIVILSGKNKAKAVMSLDDEQFSLSWNAEQELMPQKRQLIIFVLTIVFNILKRQNPHIFRTLINLSSQMTPPCHYDQTVSHKQTCTFQDIQEKESCAF